MCYYIDRAATYESLIDQDSDIPPNNLHIPIFWEITKRQQNTQAVEDHWRYDYYEAPPETNEQAENWAYGQITVVMLFISLICSFRQSSRTRVSLACSSCAHVSS